MNGFGRNLMFWLAIGFMMVFLFNVFQGAQSTNGVSGRAEMMAYSDFMAEAKAGRISDVTIKGQEVTGHFTSGTTKSGCPWR